MEPTRVSGAGHLGESNVDDWAIASLQFADGSVAQVATGVRARLDNQLDVFGSRGRLTVLTPWAPEKHGGPGLRLEVYGKDKHEEVIETGRNLYAHEADVLGDAVARGRHETAWPAMSWADSLANMRTLDRWRAAIGLTYPADEVSGLSRPVHGGPIRSTAELPSGRIPGVDKSVSRVVFGPSVLPSLVLTTVMLDDYFERGGRCVDTSYHYGDGTVDSWLGHWLTTRGVRDEMVILGKGAHTPNCTPEAATHQLEMSLELLRTDHVDIYMLHRDNPDVPIDEWVDVLEEHRRAGRFHAYGGSNWTLERVEAANEYAASIGGAGFAAVSNQLSLARMVEPVWAGCLTSFDEREWFEKTQTALMPWSSQARGFFVRDVVDDEMRRCWLSEDNLRRRERAKLLAKARGVEPIHVALAWVLHQPFPTFPLIGPMTPGETRSSLRALEVSLSPDEVAWLDLGPGSDDALPA